eukprot:gene12647-biopygen16951
MARGTKSMSPRGHVQQRLPERRAWHVQGGATCTQGVQNDQSRMAVEIAVHPGLRLAAPAAGMLRGLRTALRRPPASAQAARGGAPATRQFPPVLQDSGDTSLGGRMFAPPEGGSQMGGGVDLGADGKS